ncbi:hypothetical protein BDV24DRAFT_122713 [Aspergillus arachidicola]|uniref:Uncharacterized protein n=1 Tax=Aspergillus arachidicola TaxID=656916 RepID=A0A5N6YNR1_9EURO|nr:hypothetical protein BDV24DRAFT_122713 [Aspergillus arachidicola]
MRCLGSYTPIPDKSGYWGCYYHHRIPSTADAIGPEGRFPSPVKETPKRKDSTGSIKAWRSLYDPVSRESLLRNRRTRSF